MVVVWSIVVCSREASLPAARKLLLLLLVGHDDKIIFFWLLDEPAEITLG